MQNGDVYDHDHDHDHDHEHEYNEHDHEHDHHHEHEHDHDHEHDHEHDHDHDHDDEHDHCHHHHHCHHHDEDDEIESIDESPIALRHSSSYRSSPRSARHPRYANHAARNSISGPDGYEAFENTNNKKKRKIPTSGSISLHHSLTTDLAHMGINGTKDGAHDELGASPYYGHGSAVPSSGLGLQGAGRGRNGRKPGARNPLGVSVNGANARSQSKYDQNMSVSAKGK